MGTWATRRVETSASPRPTGSVEEGATRAAALVAIEHGHRVYREATGRFLGMTRPGFEVRVVKPRVHAELRRFGPQVVVHAGPPTPIPDLLPCRVEPSLEPTRPMVVRAGGTRLEAVNPTLSDLLATIEEAAPVCS